MHLIPLTLLMSVGELLQKVFSALWPIFLGLFVVLVSWASYKSLIWMFLSVLKKQLRKGDLDEFKRILGKNYTAKSLGGGDKRYKWNKYLFAVKANFDDEGNLLCSLIEPVQFWSLQTVLSFV